MGYHSGTGVPGSVCGTEGDPRRGSLSLSGSQGVWSSQTELMFPSISETDEPFPPWCIDEGVYASLFDPLSIGGLATGEALAYPTSTEAPRPAEIRDIWFTHDKNSSSSRPRCRVYS
jgi:hypothetical protein